MSVRAFLILAPLLLILSVGVAASSFYNRSSNSVPETTTLNAPYFEQLEAPKTISYRPFSLRASYRISGSVRVVDSDTHLIGYDAKLAPYDFLVGWNKMGDPQLLAQLSFSMSGRYFNWAASSAPEDPASLQSSLAVLSVIPANEIIAKRFATVRRYDIISLDGYVVDASRRDGWSFAGREPGDLTNLNAPYLIYVDRFSVGQPLAQSSDFQREQFLFRKK